MSCLFLSILVASSVWRIHYDCMIVCLSPLHRIGCKTYSHNTGNTFIDTKNIHYDTVKRYNNYTEKEITELKQHHYVFHFIFLSVHFSSLVLHKCVGACWVLWTRQVLLAESQQSHLPSCCWMGRPCLARLKEPPESFAVVDRRPLRETESEGHVI